VHLPLAAIEALIVGFAAGYLARVKPELLQPPPLPTRQAEA
jgi:ABC-type Co2+ transport system permease subunit